jgi:hypothetical protein
LKHPFRKLAALSSIAALSLVNTGCKEDTIINANVIPSVDSLYASTFPDTITILTKTYFDDSIVTSITPTTAPYVIHALGTVNDPFFGRSNASIYFQVIPEKANYIFSSNNPTIDSAFIVLPYTYFRWGDTSSSSTQTITAYRVTEDMSKSDVYYSHMVKGIDFTGTVSEPMTVDVSKLDDSVMVLGKNHAPHLRIRLRDYFVQILKDIAAQSGDNAAFISAMKGFCIASTDTANTTGKSLMYFILNNPLDYRRAAVQFFYHEGSNTDSVKTSFFNFTSSDCAHYNRITRNFAGYPAAQYFNSTAASDSIVLLQNEPGAAIDIKIPYLKNLPSVVVNRAQLVITRVKLSNDPNADVFFEPSRIFPVGVDNNNKLYTLLDLEPGSNGSIPYDFVDGSIQTTDLGGIKISKYIINIPREVQRAITNKTEQLHLRINGTQTYPGAYRLIAGGSNSLNRISLQITYSKL